MSCGAVEFKETSRQVEGTFVVRKSVKETWDLLLEDLEVREALYGRDCNMVEWKDGKRTGVLAGIDVPSVLSIFTGGKRLKMDISQKKNTEDETVTFWLKPKVPAGETVRCKGKIFVDGTVQNESSVKILLKPKVFLPPFMRGWVIKSLKSVSYSEIEKINDSLNYVLERRKWASFN